MRITKQPRFILSLPGLLVAVSCLLTFVGGFVYASHAGALSEKVTGKRMVTIHDDGHDRGILTKATTLRQVLKEAHIALDPHDIVEPSLDEPLVDRNYDANIYRARPVTIVDGNIHEKIMTAHHTPSQIAQDAGVTLHDEDTAAFSRTTGMVSEGAGDVMTIDRATPFTLVLYGKTIQAYTQAKTVGDMLKSKDIHLESEDTLSVNQAASVTADMRVELWRNGKQTLNQEEAIPFTTKQTEDPNRPVGYKQITTPGVKGTKNVTYEVVMKNGKEVSRKAIQSVVTKKAEAQEETIGTKPSFSGDFAAALSKLRACEAGGNYANKNNPLYRGAYQYDYSTWANYKGYHDPADAPPSVQDDRAWQTYQARGWSPWPVCGADLPDTYR